MKSFLSNAVKSNDYIEFAVLTGCTRISRESLFSDLNNIKCCDIMESEFADVIGFTQEEVDRLLSDARLSSRREEIRKWYDGYLFGRRQEIHCPWSIMNYVADAQNSLDEDKSPHAYWPNTTDNRLIRNFLEKHAPVVADDIASLLSGGIVIKDIPANPACEILDSSADNLWSLLYTAGYLTRASDSRLRRCGVDPKTASALRAGPIIRGLPLVIPNREVRTAFVGEVARWFTERVGGEEADTLCGALWRDDGTEFCRALERIARAMKGQRT